jgi:hypothetical protein
MQAWEHARGPAGIMGCTLIEGMLPTPQLSIGMVHHRGQEPLSAVHAFCHAVRRSVNYWLRASPALTSAGLACGQVLMGR